MRARTSVEERASREGHGASAFGGRTRNEATAIPDPTRSSPTTGAPSEAATDRVGSSPSAPRPEAWLEVVRRAVDSLHFGIVQVVVHDGQVTQVERTERLRFGKTSASYEI